MSINDKANTIAKIYGIGKTVIINLQTNDQADVYVYNISGQLVAKVMSARGSNSINLLKTGNYIVKVITDELTFARKVFIN